MNYADDSVNTFIFFFSSRRRHTRWTGDWSSDVCSSDLFPKEVRRMFLDRSYLIFALASFLICVPLQFYYAFTNPFLVQIGVANAAGKMTRGQGAETLCRLSVPLFCG